MEIFKKVSLLSLLLFLCLLPWSFSFANIFLYIFFAGVVFDKKLYNKFSWKNIEGCEKWVIITSGSYYLWCLISILWTDNINRGFQLFGRYIPIILFPVFLNLAKVNGIIKNLKLLIGAFALGVIISSFMCIYLSYQDCWCETDNGLVFNSNLDFRDISFIDSVMWGFNHFSYVHLAHFIHPSYYSLYFLFITFAISESLMNDMFFRRKLIVIIILLYLSLFVFFLQSRGSLLAFIVTIFLFILYRLLSRGKHIIMVTIGVLLSIFAAVTIIKHSRLSWEFTHLKEFVFNSTEILESGLNNEDINPRIIVWYNALQVIKENPILGVGIGDTDTELEKQYKKNNLDFEYGTHNQYIYAQLSMGIVGLFLLLAMLFVPLYYGIKNRYFPLIGFSVAVMINLLFENMLTRSAGLMFIPWATMLLLMMSEEKKNELAK
jgi:hypothetical protein